MIRRFADPGTGNLSSPLLFSLAPLVGYLFACVEIFFGAFFEPALALGVSKMFQTHVITCAIKGDVG
jgi:hypothetical protein